MNCIHCQQPINPLRLKALPGTKTCVECSTTGAKRGIIGTFGEKDHTWNDVVFLEENEYEKYLKSNKKAKFTKIEDIERDNLKDLEEE